MPKYLPFHPDTGIHTSNSICESADGLVIPCTRQNGGKVLYGPFCGPSGGVKTPASTVLAEVMPASFSVRDVNFSHSAAADAMGDPIAMSRKTALLWVDR